MCRVGRLGQVAVVWSACLLLGCAPVSSPPESKVTYEDGFAIEFAEDFPDVQLVETGRGPDGANYWVVRGQTKLLFVLEGGALGFPVFPDGTIRRQSANPVAVNIVNGRVREYRFRYHRDGQQDMYVQVAVLPSDGPDRDLAERIAASIRVD